MNKDFWERLNRLEELAGKATQGDWKANTNDYGSLVVSYNGDDHDLIIEPIEKSNAEYMAAANPAMIQEMVAEMRRLEQEADWLAEWASTLAGNVNGCEDGCSMYDGSCPHTFIRAGTYCTEAEDWREAARKAVEEQK